MPVDIGKQLGILRRRGASSNRVSEERGQVLIESGVLGRNHLRPVHLRTFRGGLNLLHCDEFPCHIRAAHFPRFAFVGRSKSVNSAI